MAHGRDWTRMLGGAVVASLAAAACGTPSASLAPPAEVRIAIEQLVFAPGLVRVPALTEVHVVVVNLDTGVPHGFELKVQGGLSLVRGEIVEGPAERTYVAPPLAPGIYDFFCPVHPNMQGRLQAS